MSDTAMTDDQIPDDPFRELARRWPAIARVAIHESGHALAALVLSRPVLATAIDAGDAHCLHLPIMPGNDATALRGSLLILAAGPVAQKMFDPVADDGGSADESRMSEIAGRLCGALASPEHLDYECNVARRRAATLLRERWREVEALATSLIRHHEVARSIRPIDNLESLD